MCRKSRVRNPLFARRWFSDDVIILCVRWYLRFRLSYRDLASIAAELGIAVALSMILRWVIRYTGEFVRRWDPFELVVGRSWRADETYVKVNGAWMYLYRAVDKQGHTVASYLSRTRDYHAQRRKSNLPDRAFPTESATAGAHHQCEDQDLAARVPPAPRCRSATDGSQNALGSVRS